VFYDPPDTNDPQAMHLAVVLVDADSGAVTLRDVFAIDDCGTVINPMIVEGQVHGGLAQGIGQALLEHGVYDADTGQLLSGSYMDYAMPRADDLPSFTVETVKGTPCTHNPLGVKGCGEAGAIGSPAALINAVCNAIGVKDLPMPASPYNVWRAVQAAR
jgi:carbon-monoxide dehydrogenase large subunit